MKTNVMANEHEFYVLCRHTLGRGFDIVSHWQEPRTFVVVGAGPTGCLISHYLFQRGFNVQVFERHPPIQSSFPADDDEDGIHLVSPST